MASLARFAPAERVKLCNINLLKAQRQQLLIKVVGSLDTVTGELTQTPHRAHWQPISYSDITKASPKLPDKVPSTG